MLVRPARPEDLSAIIALDSYAEAHPERIEEIRAWAAAGQLVVLERNGQLAAYAALTRTFFHQPFIEMLMVDRRHRREGLGRALLSALVAHKTEGKLWSSTNQSNGAMQRLFLRTGFISAGTITHLDEDDPELIFVHLSAEDAP